MNVEDYTLGTKPNPYSWDDFNDMSENENWQCGWIYNENHQKIYVDGQKVGRSFNGAQNNPYSESTFYEMRNHGIWTGGFVSYGNDTRYVKSDEDAYYGTGATLGSQDNPWPLSLFEELCINEIWDGGWVTYPNGTDYYIDTDMVEPDIEGCGCDGEEGSGYSEGEGGYGCGSVCDGKVFEGSGTASTFAQSNGQVILSWTEGYLTRSPYSEISVSVNFVDSIHYEMGELSVSCRWTGFYGILVDGFFTYKHYPYGKQSVYQTHYVTINMGTFTIPTSYRDI